MSLGDAWIGGMSGSFVAMRRALLLDLQNGGAAYLKNGARMEASGTKFKANKAQGVRDCHA